MRCPKENNYAIAVVVVVLLAGEHAPGINSLRHHSCGSTLCLLASRARFIRDSIHHTRREEKREKIHGLNVKILKSSVFQVVSLRTPTTDRTPSSLRLLLCTLSSLDIRVINPYDISLRVKFDETRIFTNGNTHAAVSLSFSLYSSSSSVAPSFVAYRLFSRVRRNRRRFASSCHYVIATGMHDRLDSTLPDRDRGVTPTRYLTLRKGPAISPTRKSVDSSARVPKSN